MNNIGSVRDKGQSEVVSSCDPWRVDATVQKDERHQDVVHVALMTGQKYKGDAMLRRVGGREKERERASD